MIYMVEHNFAEGHIEEELKWNEWYSNHSTFSFRKVPGWRTGQRFIAVAHSAPKYRAFYTLDRADVLESPEYKMTTGGKFPIEFRSLIRDFHRDLADGDWMPAVENQQCLVIVDPGVRNDALPDLTWWNIVGLDKTVERRAFAVVDRSAGLKFANEAIEGVGVYQPIFERWKI